MAMTACPKCGGNIGKSSPEHTEVECLHCGWTPAEKVNTPIHPTIFDGFGTRQLHISGMSFDTIGDAPSMPTKLILTNRGRRWELLIRDAYETDRQGRRI